MFLLPVGNSVVIAPLITHPPAPHHDHVWGSHCLPQWPLLSQEDQRELASIDVAKELSQPGAEKDYVRLHKVRLAQSDAIRGVQSTDAVRAAARAVLSRIPQQILLEELWRMDGGATEKAFRKLMGLPEGASQPAQSSAMAM